MEHTACRNDRNIYSSHNIWNDVLYGLVSSQMTACFFALYYYSSSAKTLRNFR